MPVSKKEQLHCIKAKQLGINLPLLTSLTGSENKEFKTLEHVWIAEEIPFSLGNALDHLWFVVQVSHWRKIRPLQGTCSALELLQHDLRFFEVSVADRRHQIQHSAKGKTIIPSSVIGSFIHAGLKSNWEPSVQWELAKKSSRRQLCHLAAGRGEQLRVLGDPGGLETDGLCSAAVTDTLHCPSCRDLSGTVNTSALALPSPPSRSQSMNAHARQFSGSCLVGKGRFMSVCSGLDSKENFCERALGCSGGCFHSGGANHATESKTVKNKKCSSNCKTINKKNLVE